MIQGPTGGHNVRAQLERRLRQTEERLKTAEDALFTWRQRALDAEADAQACREALDELIDAYSE